MIQDGNAQDSTSEARPFDWTQWAAAAGAYALDAWQRTVLYADVRRQRGNQYRAHLQERVPNVLQFEAEPVMSGLDLPRPVNYGLVRILPGEGSAVDPSKRPFVVVDPRAGHGPGIGGFKPDSEIGAALMAGHPCYFVGFLPDPVPGQTVEDVMHAEAEFLRRVAELHPDSLGKPAVIGNCQAGWQVLMTAAVWPELFGPIILAGAPLSYWAGKNPMRYAGGLLGGSWLTAMTSDLGAGRFDGAWLVQNFEQLDPANTLWAKQYNLYSKVDTEAQRYLGFEKYWGGHVFLDGGEMQYIVDNLFIGNKLATAELVTSDGVRIDLRNVRSPIVVFCSYGDNITPPPQALGWITDLYRNDDDVTGHDQTIVFATHDSIGHLGIFVSGSVGRKEHREFAANIDLIDLLPAGIYRAEVEDHPAGQGTASLIDDPYLLKIRRSGLEEVRAIVQPDPDAERRFAAAARVSEINLALYRNLAQPWVRALSTPLSARWLQALHPLRIGYEWWSDQHPLAAVVADTAEQVRTERQPVHPSNPFWQTQERVAQAIERMLDSYRDHRDAIYAIAFDTLYGSPAIQALAGQSVHDAGPARRHPGDSPEHRAYLAGELARLDAGISDGGLPEALIRGLTWIFQARGEADDRHFHHAWNLLLPHIGRTGSGGKVMATFRALVRRQALLVQRDPDAAIAAIPRLLADVPAQTRRDAAAFLGELVAHAEQLSRQEQAGLQRILALFAVGDGTETHDESISKPQSSSPPAPAVPAKPRSRVSAKPAAPAKASALRRGSSTRTPARPARKKP